MPTVPSFHCSIEQISTSVPLLQENMYNTSLLRPAMSREIQRPRPAFTMVQVGMYSYELDSTMDHKAMNHYTVGIGLKFQNLPEYDYGTEPEPHPT